MDGLSRDIIRLRDCKFKEIPSQIANDTKYIPHFKIRYHPSEFHGANPIVLQEIFNRIHSSLKSCIERAFGILKVRWKILAKMPIYSSQDQNRIICVAFALYNYIRLSKFLDLTFRVIDANPNFIPPKAFLDAECISTQEVERISTNEMTKARNDFTTSLIAARQQRRVS
ncbi:hypothetical protein PVK06_024859 [Gossypium arboreum]|uniref:DDE Tnp4 domain-containing protein n=1 Tax=Gossypium arboreum TaxID=29729 RepID=A0ABR0PF86_GOSAR|nr:hypothetical protein PVK06_024859 [Gossypium arboreum]